MSLPLRLLPEARAELDDAIDWYDGQQPGLGAIFLARVREVFRRIAANPRMHGRVHGQMRRAVVQKFPYVVIDREQASEVIVLSVFHTSRNPRDWQARG